MRILKHEGAQDVALDTNASPDDWSKVSEQRLLENEVTRGQSY